MKFVDGNLIDAELANIATREDTFIRSWLKPEAVEHFKKKEEESFNKAKEKWIGLAKKNDEQMSGFLNDILGRNKAFLYQLLQIKPAQEVLGVVLHKNT